MSTKTQNIVYLALNTVNGKRYIGITKLGLDARRRQHEHSTAKGGRMYLNNAIRKYGRNAFEWTTLNTYPDYKSALAGEKAYIDFYNTLAPNGYNCTTGGEGWEICAATRAKMSVAHKGKKFSAAHRANIGAAVSGANHYNYGRHLPASQKDKISIALSGTGNPFYGKTHSIATRAKIIASNVRRTGERRSAATRAKMSAAWTEERRAKASAALSGANNPFYGKKHSPNPFQGKKHSPESRAKISAAWTEERRAKLIASNKSRARINITQRVGLGMMKGD